MEARGQNTTLVFKDSQYSVKPTDASDFFFCYIQILPAQPAPDLSYSNTSTNTDF